MLNEQEILKRIFCIINHVRAGMGQLGAADSAPGHFGAASVTVT